MVLPEAGLIAHAEFIKQPMHFVETRHAGVSYGFIFFPGVLALSHNS
jgi:hypothetical protein